MSEILTVRKKNEVYITVSGDRGIEMELSEFFTFEVPGARFMPAYRNKMWDGKIRLYDSRRKTVYAGLLDEVIQFAASRGYSLNYENDPVYGLPNAKNSITPESLHAWTKDIPLHVNGSKIEPRPYQLEAIYHGYRNRRNLLLSPTASGKSLIIYMLIRKFLQENEGKVLLVVPLTSLVEQMYGDFAEYSKNDDMFDVEKDCHRIYSGKEKIGMSQRVIITTWQSIFKMPDAWFAPYRMMIGDEAHGFKSKSLCAIMEKLRDCPYRIGTTGTLDGAQTNERVLQGLFGPVHRVTTTRDLIDAGMISDLKIEILQLGYTEEERKMAKHLDYQAEIDFLVSHEKRNRLIRNLAIDQKGNTLVLFSYVQKHLIPVHRDIAERLAKTNPGRKVFLVYGGVEAEEREAIRAIVEKEKDAIICAGVQVFSTGINIRNLHGIIFASPFKSQIRVLQSIGRGLRKSDDGRRTTVFDLADDLSWKKHRNYTLDHAKERVMIYGKERFDFTINDVPLIQ